MRNEKPSKMQCDNTESGRCSVFARANVFNVAEVQQASACIKRSSGLAVQPPPSLYTIAWHPIGGTFDTALTVTAVKGGYTATHRGKPTRKVTVAPLSSTPYSTIFSISEIYAQSVGESGGVRRIVRRARSADRAHEIIRSSDKLTPGPP
jgi:hypothetical protein